MIKIIKLSTGEELIGDVTDSNMGYKVVHPCMLQLIPSRNNNEPTMGMFPYAIHTKEHTILVGKEHVIWTEEPVTDLYNQYNSVFGSGIVMTGAGTPSFHPV